MDRREFLKKLKEALENDLSGPVVQENIDYYDHYIMEEVKSGKSEEEVTAMLGDPWMIGRTVIDAAEMGIHQESYREESKKQNYTKEESADHTQDFMRNMFKPVSKWRKYAFIAGIVLVLFLVISVLTGIVRFLAPLVIPIVLIVFLVRMFSNRR